MKEIFETLLFQIRKLNKVVKYQNSFETINQSKVIESNCNAIVFVSPPSNTDVVFINGWPLLVGATLSLNGNSNEIDITKYRVDMPLGNQTILIIRKINE